MLGDYFSTGMGCSFILVVTALVFSSVGYHLGYCDARTAFLDSPRAFATHALDWQTEGNLDRQKVPYPGTYDAQKIADPNK